MPQILESIELHDSEISSIENIDGVLCIYLSHAYIHCDGKGWSQKAKIKIKADHVSNINEKYPIRISDGELFTTLGLYHNLLFLPLSAKGQVTLKLEIVSGSTINVIGYDVEIELIGERIFIESLE